MEERVCIKLNADSGFSRNIKPKNRITNVQATVVQKLNQGTIPQSGCYRLRAPFLVLFWRSKKEQ